MMELNKNKPIQAKFNNKNVKTIKVNRNVRWEEIPSRYTRAKYIQNTGNAYIDTGIIPTTEMDFYYKAYVPIEAGNTSSGFNAVYWTRTYRHNNGMNEYNTFGSIFTSDPNIIRAYKQSNGNPIYTTTIQPLGTRMIEWQTHGNSYTINGQTYNFSQLLPYSVPYNLYLFIHSSDGSIGYNYSNNIKLYEWKITQNGNLLQHFVPVYDTVARVYGMWDKVTRRFFGNAHAVGSFLGEI